MARQFNGSSQYIYNSTGFGVSTYPYTMACWFNVPDVTADHSLMNLTDTSGNQSMQMMVEGTRAGDPITFRAYNGGASAARTSTSVTASTWHHALIYSSSATARSVFLNGGGKASNTTSRALTAGDSIYIGVTLEVSTLVRYNAGMVAEPAVWNVVLTDAEVAWLATGVSPRMVRPESLVFYSPFVAQGEMTKDWIQGITLTENSVPTTGAHPSIWRPTSQVWSFKGSGGAPPSFTIPLYVHRLQQGFS